MPENPKPEAGEKFMQVKIITDKPQFPGSFRWRNLLPRLGKGIAGFFNEDVGSTFAEFHYVELPDGRRALIITRPKGLEKNG